jgi:hypothetical protein
MSTFRNKILMKKSIPLYIFLIILAPSFALAQTSWKGTTSTNWSTASNWTNGIPSSAVDAIIGDAYFTGPNQPTISSAVSCKSLTIGTGTKVSVLTVSSNLTVNGNVMIGVQGTITSGRTISLRGNWTNSGTYSATWHKTTVTFSGSNQSIYGLTSFRNITINTGSMTVLHSNITVTGKLTVDGILEPGNSPTYTVSGNGSLTVNSTGKLLVKASVFTGNYNLSGGVTLNIGSIVDYASASIDQTVSNAYTYRNLRISGGTTKVLNGNLPAISTSLTIAAGTFNLST